MTTNTTPRPKQKRIEIINKPQIDVTKRSIRFFWNDKRKVISLVIVLLLPILNNSWRFVSEEIPHDFYGTLQAMVWTFSIQFMVLAIGVAWYFSIPKKDQVLQFMALSVVAYGTLLTYQTFYVETPLWLDIIASAIIFLFIFLCLRYIQRHYLEPADYKTLHDGLVHDIHHQRFLGSIDRIEGLVSISKMEEPYQQLCAEEIQELKKSIAYIADKYESLR